MVTEIQIPNTYLQDTFPRYFLKLLFFIIKHWHLTFIYYSSVYTYVSFPFVILIHYVKYIRQIIDIIKHIQSEQTNFKVLSVISIEPIVRTIDHSFSSGEAFNHPPKRKKSLNGRRTR